ncbi:MAG: PepSY-associated TM helix domain-containing protein, partial [Ilumatobacteraceae bacterium]
MVTIDEELSRAPAATEPVVPPSRTPRRRVRRLFMRPRHLVVTIHRWTSIALLAWIVVVSLTGAWLVFHNTFEGWLNPGRFDTTAGDIGPQAATDATLAAAGDGAEVTFLTLPRNGRGVYQVFVEVPVDGAPEPAEGEEPLHDHFTYFVDPGSGVITDRASDTEGISWWLYRGHMYLWQDWGPFGAFDPETGWCTANAEGVEPGGVTGVVCDVLPDGMDIVGWLGVLFIVVLLSGFYVWYWPGVRRWATAFVVKRGRGAFTFNMTLHKVIGIVVWVPLLVVAFTGIAFAFPNLDSWFENATPAQEDFYLWTQPEGAVSEPVPGGEPLDHDEALAAIEQRYPDRAVQSLMPPWDDETATYSAWVTRGFDPWTREAGAGNAFVAIDQFSGEVVYDGIPGEGNVFDQAWDDWSFPLHTGDFGGTATRVIWTGLALAPIALGTTGLLMYL